MKNYITILICFVLSVFIFACSEEAQSPQVTVKQTEKSLNNAQEPVKAEKKIADEWPFIKIEADDEGDVSDNLVAKNYMLIFDGSGSMGEIECGDGRQKISVAKEAVTEWAKTLPKDSKLGLVAFYHNKWSELPLKSGNRNSFMKTIQSIFPSGRTPLTEGLHRAYSSITAEGKKQLGYGDYTIVVVTEVTTAGKTSIVPSIAACFGDFPMRKWV